MQTYLKVKIKSLAEEARIIRLEEDKAKKRIRKGRGEVQKLYNGLYLHRVRDVRHEQRSTLIAYAMLRGKTRGQTEPNCKKWIDTKRVAAMLQRYSPEYAKEKFEVIAKAIENWAGSSRPD